MHGLAGVMRVAAIINRELRAEARNSANYQLRMAVAAAAMVLLTAVLTLVLREMPAVGLRLFGTLQAAVFSAIWLLVPPMAADCISRERREGTLGLLFLTPLTATGVVLAKCFVHGLRALVVLGTMVPVIALPMVMGGITWKDAVVAICLNGSALCLALGAGVLASSLSKEWPRTLTLSLVFSVALGLAFMYAHFVGFLWMVGNAGAARFVAPPGSPVPLIEIKDVLRFVEFQPLPQTIQSIVLFNTWMEFHREFGFGLDLGTFAMFQVGWVATWSTQALPVQWAWIRLLMLLLGGSGLVLLGLVQVAAMRVRSSWQEEPPSIQRQRVKDVFCRPRFWRSRFKAGMNRSLDTNPVGWLHRYSVGARLTQWGWCLAVVVAEAVLVMDSQHTFLWEGQYWLAALLLGSVAFSAAGSFRREQQNGALELLLVTPLREWQVITGRLRGVWRQFLPGFVVLALAWLWLRKDIEMFAGNRFYRLSAWSGWVFPSLCLIAYLVLPAAGLHAAVRRMNFVAAWLWAMALGLGVPAAIWFAAERSLNSASVALWLAAAAQVAVAIASLLLVFWHLSKRQFAGPNSTGES